VNSFLFDEDKMMPIQMVSGNILVENGEFLGRSNTIQGDKESMALVSQCHFANGENVIQIKSDMVHLQNLAFSSRKGLNREFANLCRDCRFGINWPAFLLLPVVVLVGCFLGRKKLIRKLRARVHNK
jgi:hypothetical protein